MDSNDVDDTASINFSWPELDALLYKAATAQCGYDHTQAIRDVAQAIGLIKRALAEPRR